MQRQRDTQSRLWKQLQEPTLQSALESIVAAYGAENLLPLLLQFLKREKSAEWRAGFGCLAYLAIFWVCCALCSVWEFSLLFAVAMVLFSPVFLFVLSKIGKTQTPRRVNLTRLLRYSVRDLTDSTAAAKVISAIRSIGLSEDATLRRELRQELERLLLRLPTESARRLTRIERLYLRLWLWDAMKWDQAGDADFCIAALLVLGDAKDWSVVPHAWLCTRWHRTPRVRAAASACLDELFSRGHSRSE
ncbi:hypothetical protein [Armatimonas rosea]|uniref:Uncharacterized protein n=1 Tax=Armatimonas rosea TaxID=685828 RepID=A0A7W9SKZ6_ARMRO|nr:hypothetical protein [Armatimonas rosea]MBB6048515.1 hypothetical protein [Armatimonas rosea]